MNIVRQAPKHLVLATSNSKDLVQSFKDHFEVNMIIGPSETMYDTYLDMFGFFDDTTTIIIVTRQMKANLSISQEDIDYILAIKKDCEDILITLLKLKSGLHIDDIRATSRTIVMRTVGDKKRYMAAVQKDVAGDLVSSRDINEQYASGTIIIFTEKRLNSPISVNELSDQSIYTTQDSNHLLKLLGNNYVKYVNAGLDNKDWQELVIKIYDSKEQYHLHYQRLTMVLNELDCGLILGESWGKDAALTFLSVGVYQVRLFTYMDVQEIKKIAFGLEYNLDGKRLVDYDLYTKRKKHSWYQVRTKDLYRREELGLYYRKKLMNEISEEVSFELLALERQIQT